MALTTFLTADPHYWYCQVATGTAHDRAKLHKMNTFLSYLKAQGLRVPDGYGFKYQTVTKPGHHRTLHTGLVQRGVDTAMAATLMESVALGAKHIVLISGDGDFEPTLARIQQAHHVTVWVVGGSGSVSSSLLDLTQNRRHYIDFLSDTVLPLVSSDTLSTPPQDHPETPNLHLRRCRTPAASSRPDPTLSTHHASAPPEQYHGSSRSIPSSPLSAGLVQPGFQPGHAGGLQEACLAPARGQINGPFSAEGNLRAPAGVGAAQPSFAGEKRAVVKFAQLRYKADLCIYWATAGRCLAGSRCTWAHGPEELRRPPAIWKKSLCKDWTRRRSCVRGEYCRFAHGKAELYLEPPADLSCPDLARCAGTAVTPGLACSKSSRSSATGLWDLICQLRAMAQHLAPPVPDSVAADVDIIADEIIAVVCTVEPTFTTNDLFRIVAHLSEGTDFSCPDSPRGLLQMLQQVSPSPLAGVGTADFLVDSSASSLSSPDIVGPNMPQPTLKPACDPVDLQTECADATCCLSTPPQHTWSSRSAFDVPVQIKHFEHFHGPGFLPDFMIQLHARHASTPQLPSASDAYQWHISSTATSSQQETAAFLPVHAVDHLPASGASPTSADRPVGLGFQPLVSPAPGSISNAEACLHQGCTPESECVSNESAHSNKDFGLEDHTALTPVRPGPEGLLAFDGYLPGTCTTSDLLAVDTAGSATNPESASFPHVCDFCSQSFWSLPLLQWHTKAIHGP
eukprot:gene4081-4420_t